MWSTHLLAAVFVAPWVTAKGIITAATNNDFYGQNRLQPSQVHAASNWAIIVETSRYWHNYRHAANALSFYRSVKKLGIPDNQILLFMADDFACNSRNVAPGSVFNQGLRGINAYGTDVEVDFRTDETSVEVFIRLLTGRQDPWTPRSQRLMTNENSNIFIFMTGHGGKNFLKFQDWEEIGSHDIARALIQMQRRNRYRQILFVADTCQGATLASAFSTPNVLSIGSAAKDENSWSHSIDGSIGVSVIDRFTYYSLLFFEKMRSTSNQTISDWINSLSYSLLHSTVVASDDLNGGRLSKSKVTDFLGSSGSSQFLFPKPFYMEPVT